MKIIENSFFKVKSTIFFNGLYFFKLGLFALSLINFSVIYNLIVFFLLCIHISKPGINRLWRFSIGTVAFILFYHDSYLPSIEQIIAQKDNLTNFSLDYIIEFINGFVNFYMVIAFVIAIFALKILNQYVRAFSIILLLMITLPFMNLDMLRVGISNDDVIRVNDNLFTIKINKKNLYTQSNLDEFESDFYDSQEDLNLFAPSIPESFTKFNIIFVQVDGLSNYDFSKLDLTNISTLNRFDMYLTHFNTVSTDSATSANRLLFASLCGQKKNEELDDIDSKCSLVQALKNIGYKTQFIFDESPSFNKIQEKLFDTEIINSISSDNLIDTLENSSNSIQKFSSQSLFQYIHISPLADEKNSTAYKQKAATFLIRIGRLMDKIEKAGLPTLLILLPSHGSFVFNDITQPAGFGFIPSKRLTEASAMIKFFRGTSVNETAVYDENVSYMGLSELIFRILKSNSFNESTLFSPKALVEDLPKTKFVNDSQTASFIEINNKQFYKMLDSKWTEYKE